MTGTTDLAAIARGMSRDQLAAWKACEWEGEYFNPPALPVWDRRSMRRKGLLDEDNSVTLLGEALIRHLNPPSFLRRMYAVLKHHLQELDNAK